MSNDLFSLGFVALYRRPFNSLSRKMHRSRGRKLSCRLKCFVSIKILYTSRKSRTNSLKCFNLPRTVYTPYCCSTHSEFILNNCQSKQTSQFSWQKRHTRLVRQANGSTDKKVVQNVIFCYCAFSYCIFGIIRIFSIFFLKRSNFACLSHFV